MVGLAAPRNRQKIANDPRNTAWSSDTGRFGHKHMQNLGWQPGTGLGLTAASRSVTTNLKINVKSDNAGLGASLAKAQDADNWAPGLDSFQALLSRLNNGSNDDNKENDSNDNNNNKVKETIWETETKISQTYNRLGKWGSRVKFVLGEKLEATLKNNVLDINDIKTEEFVSLSTDNTSESNSESEGNDQNEGNSKKRKRDENDNPSKEEKKKKKKKDKSTKRNEKERIKDKELRKQVKEEKRQRKEQKREKREEKEKKRLEKEQNKLQKEKTNKEKKDRTRGNKKKIIS
ncbi:hypothetical protein V1514DRAFT_370271 [Lipomyces japonicus]|uniref:uncharacterized protein n=1 Tax=Lipomyces japonicus TaxID=56871 RepID=UPI0034CFC245